jgi:hypothetical protein
VANRLYSESTTELTGAEKCLAEASAAEGSRRTGKARIFNIMSFFGTAESSLQDITTADGSSIYTVKKGYRFSRPQAGYH